MYATTLADLGADSRTVFVSSHRDLNRILSDDVNIVVLRRSLPSRQADTYRRMTDTAWERRVGLDLHRLDAGIAELVNAVKDSEAVDSLAAEVEQWAWRFASLVERRHIGAQLMTISTDMCRKFHTDFVEVRLLCTLFGPATEWLNDEDVVRSGLSRFDLDLEEANRAVLRPEAAVQHATAGDIILLKGDAWPGNEGRGAVHRSPPIEDHGDRRLLLKLETAPCRC